MARHKTHHEMLVESDSTTSEWACFNDPECRTTVISGPAAIWYAEAHELPLHKFADPSEGPLDGLTVDEAREIANRDPFLIWVEVRPEDG